MQFDRISDQRVVNAGAGCRSGIRALLAAARGRRHGQPATRVRPAAAAARVRATAFPWPEDFAARYILQPPSAAEMLDVFTRASI